jgi:hypothetical protein
MVAELRDARTLARSVSIAEENAAPKSKSLKTEASGAERRREPRYPCNDPVEIRIIPGAGSRIPGTLLDVSRSGLRIELDSAVPKGTQVEILLSRQLEVSGRVRHCRRVGAKYQAGVLILEAMDSSKPNEHVSEELLSSYLGGRGLTLTQAIRVRDHLAACSTCRLRVVDSYSVKPQPRRSSS